MYFSFYGQSVNMTQSLDTLTYPLNETRTQVSKSIIKISTNTNDFPCTGLDPAAAGRTLDFYRHDVLHTLTGWEEGIFIPYLSSGKLLTPRRHI